LEVRSQVPVLTVASYNTYRERKGRDTILDELLGEDALICLQEVSISRARELRREFGPRVYLSWVMHGWQRLAIILPKDLRFTARHTRQLTAHFGILPRIWSISRVLALYAGRRHGWSDGLSARAIQITEVSGWGKNFRVMNTHLPYESGLRDRCFMRLPGMVGDGDVLLAGDLNATPENVFLRDLLLTSGLKASGEGQPTHNSRHCIDYVLYRGGFREVGFSRKRGLSDHRLVTAELELEV
jgi:endonuclease/exonuclease/phosphatase family metal-dependent hydrolase